jgi:hypothetical protein
MASPWQPHVLHNLPETIIMLRSMNHLIHIAQHWHHDPVTFGCMTARRRRVPFKNTIRSAGPRKPHIYSIFNHQLSLVS